ncbi:hypothetical protein WR25_15039 [Diploscapter pachys]|uniref:Magnesium chelatase ChlI-like catalytic domain-containing protein n=1 Tax=Diploscapter pachys TaxID=2018661 RepID=A0A2A2K825_9BILA|nr:hypothetical protein WR25_15039 [Diploscapter pachys]
MLRDSRPDLVLALPGGDDTEELLARARETTVKESKDRVRSAIVNSGLDYPARRITQSLAPADLPKDGGRYDLAIALGILAANGQVPVAALDGIECLGELALSGTLRSVQGRMPRKTAWPTAWWCTRWGVCENWQPT